MQIQIFIALLCITCWHLEWLYHLAFMILICLWILRGHLQTFVTLFSDLWSYRDLSDNLKPGRIYRRGHRGCLHSVVVLSILVSLMRLLKLTRHASSMGSRGGNTEGNMLTNFQYWSLNAAYWCWLISMQQLKFICKTTVIYMIHWFRRNWKNMYSVYRLM